MSNLISTCRFVWLCCLCLLLPANIQGQHIRQLSNRDGLSNSAILSLYQDERGLIWIGSCDGLNVFDGTDVHLYTPNSQASNLISGNLINGICSTRKDVLWVQTNYGLDRLDAGQESSLHFSNFKDNNVMVESPANGFFTLKDDGCIYHFDEKAQTFRQLTASIAPFGRILAMSIDRKECLWVITQGEQPVQCFRIEQTGNETRLTPQQLPPATLRLKHAFAEEDQIYFVDTTYGFYEYDLNNRKAYFIADLSEAIRERGEISSIAKQGNDYYIGFKSNGLMILRFMPNQKTKYELQDTEIQCGIFCLMKDRFQDIVWIGTDGQGVYMYFNESVSITNTLLNTPLHSINNPVRALYYDHEQTLWVGTKGDGILRIPHYVPDNSLPLSFQRITASGTALSDNSVYCFAPSRRELLWIGTEKGLNYYSYATRRLYRLPVTAGGKSLKYIHDIKELNDTTLWISTVGEGVVKVTLHRGGRPMPRVKSATRKTIDQGKMPSNYFFTSYQENDSLLWFGNRGQGAFCMNVATEEWKSYRFDNIVDSRTANDIFAIYKNPAGYWMGTSSGLLHFPPDRTKVGEALLLSRNTVHGILEDPEGNLWLSTNQGLVRFDPKSRTHYVYNHKNGLGVSEFSDGAFFRDPQSGLLFFGGTNGFVTLKPDFASEQPYMPHIWLQGISIFGKKENINRFLREDNGELALQLKHDQDFFQITFKAIDYINGNNYTYFYKIDEINSQWIGNETSTDIVLSNMTPGKYTLQIKYRNNSNGQESRPQTVIIRILPPWYLTYWAYAAYALLVIGLAAGFVYRVIRRYRRKQLRTIEKINQQKKEEIYESKLRFFTNITHEFCTPLTLIYGPCERILSHQGTDDYIRKYATMIRQNAEKLNSLILELLEFRRLETGNKVLDIQEVPVSESLENTANLFGEMAEQRGIEYKLEIAPGIKWNTDVSCFNKIAGNLLSNAFKYTPGQGQILLSLTGGPVLTLRVSNSGKGIAREDLPKIFDRYKVLDSFEMSGKGSRTGLGLAICKHMATLLKGEITVESVVDGMTTFTVTLPPLPPSEVHLHAPVYQEAYKPVQENTVIEEKNEAQAFDENKRTVMVIDDETSMLWLVSEIFASKYNVCSFSNAEEAIAELESRQPDLIISDVMMPGTDGLSFAQKLKQNKLWRHIPLILLSALNHEDDRMKGIESGADAYITKPFNIHYLEKMADRLIQRENELKDYYNSVFSSFQVENGKLQSTEDREFMKRLLSLIEENLSSPELSIDMLSQNMGYSPRQFYRKLKDCSGKAPTELIKECRLVMAERLLVSQNLTIEQIMQQTGFTNRGTFYKTFSQQYGIPPLQYRKQQRQQVEQEKGDKPDESDAAPE